MRAFPGWHCPAIGSRWLTSLQQRPAKTGGRLIKHARCYWLLLAESHLTRRLFGSMLQKIAALPSPAGMGRSTIRSKLGDGGKEKGQVSVNSVGETPSLGCFGAKTGQSWSKGTGEKASALKNSSNWRLQSASRPFESGSGFQRGNSGHLFFELAVLAKGVDGAIELVGGVLLLFLSPEAIWRAIYFLIQGELTENPTDRLANLILHSVPRIIQTRFSAATFLILHGAVKLGLVVGLATNRLWSYPAAIVAFTAFTSYQLYQLAQRYSLFLAIVTVLDVVIISLVIAEYRDVRQARRLG